MIFLTKPLSATLLVIAVLAIVVPKLLAAKTRIQAAD
jgi:hypothetical protein